MQRSSDVERIRCRTLCRIRHQAGRSRLRLSLPSVGWSTLWRRRTDVLRRSGAACGPADKLVAGSHGHPRITHAPDNQNQA